MNKDQLRQLVETYSNAGDEEAVRRAAEALVGVKVAKDALAVGEGEDEGSLFATENGFTGDMLDTWDVTEVTDLARAFAGVTGFASDLRPWATPALLAQQARKTLHVRTLFLDAWDVSAGALLFQHRMVLAHSRGAQTTDALRRTARRALQLERYRRTRRRSGDDSLSLLLTACKRVTKAAAPLLAPMPAFFDPYGILSRQEEAPPAEETIGGRAAEKPWRQELKYAWFLFATLRNVLTRSELMTRPAGAALVHYESLLAYLLRRIVSTRKKRLGNGGEEKLMELGAGLAAFFEDTDELRLSDWKELFSLDEKKKKTKFGPPPPDEYFRTEVRDTMRGGGGARDIHIIAGGGQFERFVPEKEDTPLREIAQAFDRIVVFEMTRTGLIEHHAAQDPLMARALGVEYDEKEEAFDFATEVKTLVAAAAEKRARLRYEMYWRARVVQSYLRPGGGGGNYDTKKVARVAALYDKILETVE